MLLSALGDMALIQTHSQPLLTRAMYVLLGIPIASCNAGSYHMAQARVTATAPEEDALLKRTLLVQDGVLVRQAAMAAGQQARTELQRYYTERKEFYAASKVAYAGVLVVGYYAARDGAGSSSIDDALALLERCESSTVESQQDLYDMLV